LRVWLSSHISFNEVAPKWRHFISEKKENLMSDDKKAPPRTMAEIPWQTIQIVLAVLLIGIPFGLPLLTQYVLDPYLGIGQIDYNWAWAGGPQVTNPSLIQNFKVTLDVERFSLAFQAMKGWDKATVTLIGFLFVLLIAQIVFAIKDSIEGILGKKAADVGSIVALLMFFVIFIIDTPIIAAAMLIAAMPLIIRDDTGNTEWYIGPLLATAFTIAILTFGNKYLLWPTVGWQGYYRMLIHMLVSLGSGYGFILIEAIKIYFTFRLFQDATKDGSNLGVVWSASGFIALLTFSIPNSQFTGSFWATHLSGTYYYVVAAFVIEFFIIMREISLPSSEKPVSAAEAGKATTIATLSTVIHVSIYALISFLAFCTINGYFHKSIPPVWIIAVSTALAMLIAGIDESLAKAFNPAGSVVRNVDEKSMGDVVYWGPFKIWIADVELLIYSMKISSLFFPAALYWLMSM